MALIRCLVCLALQVVQVEEPGEEEAVEWLRGLAPRYGQHHGVVFTEGALRAAARCAKRCVVWGAGGGGAGGVQWCRR